MPTVFVIDDRSLLDIGGLIDVSNHIDVFSGMNQLCESGELMFPPEVVKAVRQRGDASQPIDRQLIIWIEAVQGRMDCDVAFGHKRAAQLWAQNNGYEEGLDPFADGDSCIVAVVGLILDLVERHADFVVVTNDFTDRPGRAALGSITDRLGCRVQDIRSFADECMRLCSSAA